MSDREQELKARNDARRGGFGVPAAALPVERSKDFGAALRRLGRILGRESGLLAIVVAAVTAAVIMLSFGPRLLGEATDVIVDGVIGDGIDRAELRRRLVQLGVLYVAAYAITYLASFTLAGIVQRSMRRLRRSAEHKLHRLPLAYLDNQPRGDLLSRVSNDIDNLAQSLQQTVGQMLNSVLSIAAMTVMMFTVSPLLAVVALVAVPLSLVALRFIARRARPRFAEQWQHTGALNAQTEEVFSGHAIVKTFGRQAELEAQFADENDRLYSAAVRAQFTSSLIQPTTMLVGNLQFVLIAVVGALQISSGRITVGAMQAMIQYSRQLAQPVSQLSSMLATFQSGIASLERVIELLDAPEESADPSPSAGVTATPAGAARRPAGNREAASGTGAALSNDGDMSWRSDGRSDNGEMRWASGDRSAVRGAIEFHDVAFSYHADEPLITELDLVAEPGDTVAIVGPTGAGKTTLVNLLMRFYELDGGRITIDGRDIAELSRGEVRSMFGMVLQDAWLFQGTIRDNLSYAKPDASDSEIETAAQLAYVDRFVLSLPDGYDTIVDEEGGGLSAGERQLITIARAFLADPPILILDEATSSVDTRTEVLIQEAMNNLRANRTSFVIAHRLSTIRGADQILVMEDGRITERGTHESLLALGGGYARLHHAQFAGIET